MKYVIAVALFLLAGCVTPQSVQTYPPVDVLILSPQGVNQSSDTVGFNNLVRGVTQSFSGKLSEKMTARNISNFNVLDQGTKYSTGEKLALYSVSHQAKSAVVLTIETETAGDDHRLLLQAQYVEQEFIFDGGTVRGVKPVSVSQKRYLLRSSIAGDNPGTMTDLASDYMAFLKSEGHIK